MLHVLGMINAALFGEVPDDEDEEVVEEDNTAEDARVDEDEVVEGGEDEEDNEEGDAGDGAKDEEKPTYDAAYIKKLNNENKERRLANRELRNKNAQLQLALDKLKKQQTENKKVAEREGLEEAERLRLEIDDIRNERDEAVAVINAMDRTRQVSKLAGELGFVDDDAAIALVDLEGVPMNDNGTYDTEMVKDRLQDLLERKPYLVADDQQTSKPKPKPIASKVTNQPSKQPVRRMPEQKASPEVEEIDKQLHQALANERNGLKALKLFRQKFEIKRKEHKDPTTAYTSQEWQ